jgi:hypothetical protein
VTRPGNDSAPKDATALASTAEPDRTAPTKLAEFTALRAEIERRANVQWNVFALQITSAGAIAGLAISSASNSALLLLVPFSSYMFGGRYILHDFHIKLIQRYIDESLSPRLEGELQWPGWKREKTTSAATQRPWFGVVTWRTVHPTRLAFEGVATLSLIGAAIALIYLGISAGIDWYAPAGIAVVWILGLILTWLLHRSFNRASG